MANTRVSRASDVFSERRSAVPPHSDAPPLQEPLAGYIFISNNETMEEDLKRELFGLPQKHHESVRNIQAGMPIFLYNYSVHQLHGVFEACSEGGLNVEPNATKFPAQVRVRVRERRAPLEEAKFRPLLFHYDGPKFRFELSQTETNNLLRLFGALGPEEAQGKVQKAAGAQADGDWETVKPKSRSGPRAHHGAPGVGQPYFRSKRGSPPNPQQSWRAQGGHHIPGTSPHHAAGAPAKGASPPGPALSGSPGTAPGGTQQAGPGPAAAGVPGSSQQAAPAGASSASAAGGARRGGEGPNGGGAWARSGQGPQGDTWSSSSGSGMVSPDISTTGTSSEDRSTGGEGDPEQEPLAECNGHHHEDARSGGGSDEEASSGADAEGAGHRAPAASQQGQNGDVASGGAAAEQARKGSGSGASAGESGGAKGGAGGGVGQGGEEPKDARAGAAGAGVTSAPARAPPAPAAWAVRNETVTFAAVLRRRSEEHTSPSAPAAAAGPAAPPAVSRAEQPSPTAPEAAQGEQAPSRHAASAAASSAADARSSPAGPASVAPAVDASAPWAGVVGPAGESSREEAPAPSSSAPGGVAPAAVGSGPPAGGSSGAGAAAAAPSQPLTGKGANAAGGEESEKEGWITVSAASRPTNGGRGGGRTRPQGPDTAPTEDGPKGPRAGSGPRKLSEFGITSPAHGLGGRGSGAPRTPHAPLPEGAPSSDATAAAAGAVAGKGVAGDGALSGSPGVLARGAAAPGSAGASVGGETKAAERPAVELKPRRLAWQGNDAAILRKLADPDPAPAPAMRTAPGSAPALAPAVAPKAHPAAPTAAARAAPAGTAGAVAKPGSTAGVPQRSAAIPGAAEQERRASEGQTGPGAPAKGKDASGAPSGAGTQKPSGADPAHSSPQKGQQAGAAMAAAAPAVKGVAVSGTGRAQGAPSAGARPVQQSQQQAQGGLASGQGRQKGAQTQEGAGQASGEKDKEATQQLLPTPPAPLHQAQGYAPGQQHSGGHFAGPKASSSGAPGVLLTPSPGNLLPHGPRGQGGVGVYGRGGDRPNRARGGRGFAEGGGRGQDMGPRGPMGAFRAVQGRPQGMDTLSSAAMPFHFTPGEPGPYGAPVFAPLGPPSAVGPAAGVGVSVGVPVPGQPPYVLPLMGPIAGFPSFHMPAPGVLLNAPGLHQEIREYAEEARPSREARLSAQRAVLFVQGAVKNLWGGEADVEVFGSYATGLALPYSDVDVAVVHAPPPPPDSPELRNLSGARISAPLIRQLAKFLQKQPWCESLYTIETARIPVIKLQCNAAYDPSATPPSPVPAPAVSPPRASELEGAPLSLGEAAAAGELRSVSPALVPLGESRSASPALVPTSGMIGPVRRETVKMDITIALSRPKSFVVSDEASKQLAAKLDAAAGAHNGAAAREFVIGRLKHYPALAPLVLLVKSYLQHRGLKDVYTGGLGSFSLTMMLVFYLERAPVSCGAPSTGGPLAPMAYAGIPATTATTGGPSGPPAATPLQSSASDAARRGSTSADSSAATAATASAPGEESTPEAASGESPSTAEGKKELGAGKEGSRSGGTEGEGVAATGRGPTEAAAEEAQAEGAEGSAPLAAGTTGSGSPRLRIPEPQAQASSLEAAPVLAKGVLVDDLLASASGVPSPNLGVLLLGFLHLFGAEIDLSKVKLLLRGRDGAPGGVYWQEPGAQPAALWVDDPLKQGTNIGSGSFAMWHVQAAFREMLSTLTIPLLPSAPSAASPRGAASAREAGLPPPVPAAAPTAPAPDKAGASRGEPQNDTTGQRKTFPLLDAAFMPKLPVPTAARPLQKS